MKKFLLKTLGVILNIVMIVSALYAVFNLVMTFLPAEIQTQVYDWLNMSKEYIATFSISSVFNAAILIASKVGQAYSKLALTKQIADNEKVMDNSLAVNSKVIEKVNDTISNLNVLQNLVNALLSVQKVTTERNINASEKLVHKNEKEAYKCALEEISKAQAQLAEIGNVTSVYERTEIKEVIVEKEEDPLSGRV